MILVEELKGSCWKPRYFIDNEAGTACEFMDSDLSLATITVDDIAWWTIDNLPEELKERARASTPISLRLSEAIMMVGQR